MNAVKLNQGWYVIVCALWISAQFIRISARAGEIQPKTWFPPKVVFEEQFLNSSVLFVCMFYMWLPHIVPQIKDRDEIFKYSPEQK